MNQKIQLKHPDGKKAITMAQEKYDLLGKAIISSLKAKGELTHKEILKTITEEFNTNKIQFDGSIEWHMEWVKLDLEARKEIIRVGDKSPVKFGIVK